MFSRMMMGGQPSGSGSSDTKLLLQFNGANGATTTVDSSPLANPVTLVSPAVLSTSSPRFGTACLAAGTGRAEIANTVGRFNIDPAASGTIEGWLRRSGANANDRIIIHLAGGGTSFSLRYEDAVANALEFYHSTNGSTTTKTTGSGGFAPSPGNWHHWYICWSGGTINFGGQGARTGSVAVGSPLFTNSTTLVLGATTAGALPGEFDHDCVRFAAQALYTGATYTVPTTELGVI